jgi:hypothetical protein
MAFRVDLKITKQYLNRKRFLIVKAKSLPDKRMKIDFISLRGF